MNVQKIDLRLLRSFFVVSRTGNFVRASHSLSITQSALSQQMKELNRYFPEALFEICEGERTLSHKRIDGNLLCRKAALCWRRDKFMTTAMKAFDEAAHRVAAKIEAN
jgi:hypothetical protein